MNLFRYLVMIMIGGLGVFTNLELLSALLLIIYFTLAFFIEILVSKRKKRVYLIPSKEEYELMKVTSVKQKEDDTLSAQEFYDKNTKEGEE